MDADFILIHKMRNGDDAAVERFVKKYYEDIYRFTYKKVEDVSSAEDVTQETFKNFFMHFDRYEHCGKVKNYLYIIAGNVCKNKFKERVAEPLEYVENSAAAEACFDKVDDSIMLKEAIKQLPEEQREIITLHYFKELKLTEIADKVGIKLSLVRYRLHRGVFLLKSIIEEGKR